MTLNFKRLGRLEISRISFDSTTQLRLYPFLLFIMSQQVFVSYKHPDQNQLRCHISLTHGVFTNKSIIKFPNFIPVHTVAMILGKTQVISRQVPMVGQYQDFDFYSLIICFSAIFFFLSFSGTLSCLLVLILTSKWITLTFISNSDLSPEFHYILFIPLLNTSTWTDIFI